MTAKPGAVRVNAGLVLPRGTRIATALLVLAAFVTVRTQAIRAQNAGPASGSIYQRFAPIDLTGTWMSIVTEDWAFRMTVPAKGEFANLPLTGAAQETANRADMAAVAAAGRACDAYGAPVIMREPGRVRISWQDPATLRIETDAGEQTRLLHFGAAPGSSPVPTRQGFSLAEWQYANGFDPLRAEAQADGGRGRGRGGPGGPGGPFGRGASRDPSGGRLKVTTAHLTPGFLRKNGVPYSARTTMTEYYNLLTEPAGTKWFVVTTVVHDPENLVVDFITSTNFRQEPDDSKWRPRPCALQ